VDWSAGAVRLLTAAVPWAADGRPRRAGISSFGFSGTNAHVILEDPSDPASTTAIADSRPSGPGEGAGLPLRAESVLAAPVLAWLVSARTAGGLAAQAERLSHWAGARPELDPAGAGWSLATTRSVFEHRAVVMGAGQEELSAGLAALSAGEPAAGVITGTAGDPGKVVFVFPGQGGQWAGMGRDLAAACPVFAARLAECGAALAPHTDWELEQVLADASALDRADVVQPALWAVMVSLAAAWQAAGVTPDAVAGHSQGEIAAATVAGILSLQDGAKVVALRSRALAALAGQGGMVSVAEPAAAVRDRIAPWGQRLSVAAVNGPSATVVSGEPAALEELAAHCEAAGVRAKAVPVDYASHSAQVEQIRDQILAALAGVTPGQAQIPMISAMTGQWLDGPEAAAQYWYDSLRAPVEFDRAVRALAGAGHRAFVEVSPHPVLTPAIAETAEDAVDEPMTVTGTLRREDGGPGRFLGALATAHVHGIGVDWAAVLPAEQPVELPTYAFQHLRYWPEPSPAPAGDAGSFGLGAIDHPLLAAGVELAAGEGYLLTGRLSLRSQPWLADHAVAGTVLLPGTAYVEMVAWAGAAAGCGRIEELALQSPLVLLADGAVQIQLVVGGQDADGRRPVEVYARAEETAPGGAWSRHASGMVGPGGPPGAGVAEEFAVWPPPGAVPADTAGLYETLADAGYGYGPVFRGLRAAWRRGGEVFAEVALPEEAAAAAAGFGVHPALLDAALHAVALTARAGGDADAATDTGQDQVRLPFAYTGVSLYAAGASVLRVRLRRAGAGEVSLIAADAAGMPVVAVDSLMSRPVAGELEAAGGLRDALFAQEWVPVLASSAPPRGWVALGPDRLGLAAGEARLRSYLGLDGLMEAVASGEQVPEVMLVSAGSAYGAVAGDGGDAAASARAEVGRVLGMVQEWLGLAELTSSRLVVVTRGAAAVLPGEGVADLAGAAVRGLMRSAQSEHPGRVVLADLPAVAAADETDPLWVLAAALESGEPELAIRDGKAHGRRLAYPDRGLLVPPRDGRPWRLEVTGRGTLDGLVLASYPQAAAPLAAGQVRIAVRAAGLNFRDVLVALGMVGPDRDSAAGVIGGEIAGVVVETGPGVVGLAAGDRVLGLAESAFGPVTVADARLLTSIPRGWSFARAASVPAAFATAWYALVDLAGARPGQRLLVHAAAGGVGMAAVAIARHLGLEVYGTASPGKHSTLADRGLDEAHVASSRDTGFTGKFLDATDGAGMDIVLNSLAGELADASLRLLPGGGAFLEMGKTDIRDPGQVARDHPGVAYRAFDLAEAGPDRLGQILGKVAGLLAAGVLEPLPVRCWDVRRAPEALRFMSQARHTGKIVLTIPPDPAARREPGTVLVTGGTGTLGGLVAGHLAATRRAAALVLASRSGPAASGAAVLAADLAERGARVLVTTCDIADRDALAGLLARVPEDAPLTGVVHAAGVLDDGVIGSLTPARVAEVMRPKADAAWHLHQLTSGMDLGGFVLFSSAASAFGALGQGNYAAGNAFLDGLATVRRAAGLPAVSLGWGLWADASGLTGHLGEGDLARMARGGVTGLSASEGLALLDAALDRDDALLIPARLDLAGLRARAARGEMLPALLHGLAPRVPGPARPAAASSPADGGADALRRQLAGLTVAEQTKHLLDLTCAHAAAVLGHASAAAIAPDRAFSDLGFDSLTAVELRNRLDAATGLRLPATLIFDYPAPVALAEYLRGKLIPEAVGQADPDENKLRQALATIPLSRFREAGLMEALLQLAGLRADALASGTNEKTEAIDVLDAESLVRMALEGERAD
jgi:acyl transferase domain-containing protein/NADPH:quinone reductase-like Zn-dependent oxidoreductase